MHDLITPAILHDRRIAYAITDRDLKVIEISSSGNGLSSGIATWLGHHLVALVPELIGSEEALADVLTGELPRFQLPWVNREQPDGSTVYLTMIDLPMRDPMGRITGLVHILEDVSEVGRLEQCITQQRNELRLLEEELRSHNAKLEARNAELRRLDEMKSAFVSIAARNCAHPWQP